MASYRLMAQKLTAASNTSPIARITKNKNKKIKSNLRVPMESACSHTQVAGLNTSNFLVIGTKSLCQLHREGFYSVKIGSLSEILQLVI